MKVLRDRTSTSFRELVLVYSLQMDTFMIDLRAAEPYPVCIDQLIWFAFCALSYSFHPKLVDLFEKFFYPKIVKSLSFQCTFIINLLSLPSLIYHFQCNILLILQKVNTINKGIDEKKMNHLILLNMCEMSKRLI